MAIGLPHNESPHNDQSKIEIINGIEVRVTTLENNPRLSAPTSDDKNLAPASTSGDGSATGLTITHDPVGDGYVIIRINGVQVDIGDGVKTREAYFSDDGGTTAKAFAAITIGDELIWNGVIAGFELTGGDDCDFDYDVQNIGSPLPQTLIVLSKTGTFPVIGQDAGKVFTNEGATGSPAARPFQLPTAVGGLHFIFINENANNLQVEASAGDTIRVGNSTSTTGGTATSTLTGDTLRIIAINSSEWIAMAVNGSWTLA